MIPREIAAPVPQGVGPLLSSLHASIATAVDATATYTAADELYVVADAESFVHAFTFLCVGLARYASGLHLRAEEGEQRISFYLTGRLRDEGRVPASDDLLPESKACRDYLFHILRVNFMTYKLTVDGTGATLCVTLARFLAQNYVVGSVDDGKTFERFVAAMCMLASIPFPENAAFPCEERMPRLASVAQRACAPL